MHHIFTLFLIAVCIFTFSTAVINSVQDDKDDVSNNNQTLDVDTIFRAIGVPFCMRKCIDGFINSTKTLWSMSGVVDNARQVCSSHAKAISCLKIDKFCDINKVFSLASSSVDYMCSKKYVLFDRMEECLAPSVDEIMNECDSHCYSRSNLTAFSQNSNIKLAATVGGNVFIVTDHLGDLCGSLQCTLPCVTKKLNQACPLSGWLILDMLIQPLDAAAVMIDQMSPPLKNLIVQKIDKRCHFAINTTKLNRIRNGDFTAFEKKL